MANYYQPEIETASREQILAWQNERLVKQVQHVWESVPYYRQKMEEHGVTPADIRGVEDLHKLPLLTKADLRDAYPYGLVGTPLRDCVRVQAASGATGRRVVAFYTRRDIDLWEDCCARAIVAAGGTADDICQVAYGYGLSAGGPGLNGGSQKVGCLTLPTSAGDTERQLQFMIDLEATILCCTPSYAASLAEAVEEQRLRDQIKLKAGLFGGEAWNEEMRRHIEEKLGIKAYDIYGPTELAGPGLSFECGEQKGLHINEDHFIAEIIDPQTGEVLPEGAVGELVLSAITKEGFPLLRYRTRDICTLTREKCACGRTHMRMSKPMGRSDDRLIIKGVSVFPSQIETVLLDQGYPANYQIIVDRVNHADTLEVRVEMSVENFSDSLVKIGEMERSLVAELKNMLGIYAKVKLVAPRALARSEGKVIRVIDKRKGR